ncbi:hypothetical protein A3A74_02200 [Candidatus Roizmanbacteria bacterium RIFCSPLOWO2_01_FULL_35_13]|uniref:Carbamoyltransferase n=1 Tax=Candidatus Roizmanbacteria bacterium RIFCSPLOWO2_01_FULL_35_13 TaxID=1802055 RepID=A0A1F7ICR3_9BACT|nr:MAG: hypothetical protein A3A74_02200 [Candidatus Roizmanbacteria bacterium RIFCSPLOWO2_01_FULL_35_13]
MNILGISAFYHDSAAALIKDGKVLCAAEEERFSRIKHDNQFPAKAVEFCLGEANITIEDVDYISYYEKPLLKFERILETFVDTYPFSLMPFLKGIPEWINQKIKVEQIIRKTTGFKGKILYIPHHLSHASATFYPSSFKEAAILTIDGVGEYQTTGLWFGKGNKINLLKSINFPHSLGLLYSTFTAFLGFKVNEDEYKLMGLAAYGKPNQTGKILKIIDVKEDGSFSMNMHYFSYREGFQMWNNKFEDIFGHSRNSNQPIIKRDKDLAASIQAVTEEIYFKILNHLYGLTKTKNLCLSGGVVLNVLANGKIYKNTPFKNIYIFGAAGDSGGAIGSALFSYHSLLEVKKRQPIKNLYLGSEYSNDEIKKYLTKYNLKYKLFKNEDELIEAAANLLNKNNIIGWFQGKMEFGPRALGSRSILCKPTPREMKTKVNIIKIREQFRPFAGSILQEKVHEYFEVPEKNHPSPFMVFCFQVKEEKIKDLAAIVHADNTCRIQTVSKENRRYYKLIKKFHDLSGIPCVLNTSFNLKGEPIVENPDQAIKDFLKTELDYLVIESFLIYKG